MKTIEPISKDQKNVNIIIAIAKSIYNAFPINTLGNLYGRWLDEREYEDFADYEAVMKKAVGEIKGVTFVKGNKRPFGFTIQIVHDDIWVDYKYALNAKGEFMRQRGKSGRVA